MQATHDGYQISDDRSRLDFPTIHAWLTQSYWAPGITPEQVRQAAQFSAVVVGAYAPDGNQVAYCRAVSDRTRFAWLADVFVDPAHRRHGLATAMVNFLLHHPGLSQVRSWLLGTRDAHQVYAPLGFEPLRHPDRFMQRYQRPPQ